MKKLLTALLLVGAPILALAAPGDTTIVTAHTGLVLDSLAMYAAPATFPDATVSFRKVTMKLQLECPNSNNCPEWDHPIQLEVVDGTDTLELARMFGVYGLGLGGLNNTWSWDVTDYVPRLRNSVTIQLRYGLFSTTIPYAYTATVTFEMIEGTAPRTPLAVHSIYYDGPAGFDFGNPADPIENYLTPVTVPIDAATAQAQFHFTPNGLGQGAMDNCGSFCSKEYTLHVDGVAQAPVAIWTNGCGYNPIMAQGGTWLNNRSNWCPGMIVPTMKHDLSADITPGSSLTLDVDMEAYASGATTHPFYLMAGNLVEYGPTNFSVDAELHNIVAPSNAYPHGRANPICNNPIVVIRNSGSTALTSATITYGVVGEQPHTFLWTGNLQFLELDTVHLPAFGDCWMISVATPTQKFYAVTSNPNGQPDAHSLNDEMHSEFDLPNQHPVAMDFVWRTNSAPAEATWQIVNAAGGVVYQSASGLAANTTYTTPVTLPDGCYSLMLEDSDCDGIDYWFSFDGTGFARFNEPNGSSVVLHAFEGDFGCGLSYQFTTGAASFGGPALATGQVQASSCGPACDGSASIMASGGTAPYSYEWSTGTQTDTIAQTDLCAGTYTVTVTDAEGCSRSLSINVPEQDSVTASVLAVTHDLNGGCTGQVGAVATGGTLPYTYQWNDPAGQTTNVATGLCAGTYLAVVSDANGCTGTVVAQVDNVIGIAQQPGAVEWSISPNPSSGLVRIEFPASLNPTGYQVLSSTGAVVRSGKLDAQHQLDLVGLADGMYFVTIFHSRGMATLPRKIVLAR